MGDLIRRQDAIRLAEQGQIQGFEWQFKKLCELPSPEPERAIKDCRNCKHGNYNDHWNTYFCYHSDNCNAWDKWEPSAEPERKKGEWIKIPEFCGDDVSGFIDNHFSCSECKKEAEINSWGFYILSDFCPNCGADMRGEQEKSK